VFAHENGGVCVVEQIAGKVRQLQKNLLGDVSVSLRRDKNREARVRRAAPQRSSTPPVRSMAVA
jgi:hypothetical protein